MYFVKTACSTERGLDRKLSTRRSMRSQWEPRYCLTLKTTSESHSHCPSKVYHIIYQSVYYTFLKKIHVTKKLNRILKKFIFLLLFQILTRAKNHTIQHLNNLSQFYFQDTMHASFIVWYLFLYVHVLYNFKNDRKFCYRYTYKIILIIKCHKNSAAIKSYRLYNF